MPARTYLTAPPGTDPTEATGRDADEPRERYVPGLAPASEPHVPSRWRTPLLVALVLLTVIAVAVAILRVSAAQQAQDPSLMVPGLLDDADDAEDTQDPDPEPGDGLPGDG